MANVISDVRDRRVYFRLEKTLPVRLRICDSKPDRIYSATSRNISHGGMCLEVGENQTELLNTLQHHPHEVKIELQTPIFDYSESSSVGQNWISGQIDWHQKPDRGNPVVLIGLSFVRLSDRTRKKLHDLMVQEYVARYGVKNWQPEPFPVFAFDIK
jgi:c-di-GMP-binding flagellar brake protein YcgR